LTYLANRQTNGGDIGTSPKVARVTK